MEKDAVMSLLYGGCAVLFTGVLVFVLNLIKTKIFKYIGKRSSDCAGGSEKE